MKEKIRILAVGDVIGRPGRDILNTRLQGIIDTQRIDFVIVNGENSAGGRSITQEIAREFFSTGVNVITTGNHIWDNSDIYGFIASEPNLLRPANYPDGAKGNGYCLKQYQGHNICVINLMGRTHMLPVDCPFRKFDQIYSEVKDKAEIIIVDFHAEATSEKRAMGWYCDGRASFVFGTHTHVQTADEEIFPGGTGYITDIGMTGPFDSVIGMEKGPAIDRFLYQVKVKVEVASGNPKINGAIFTVAKNGRTLEINRLIT